MELQPSLCSPTFQIESRFKPLPTLLLTPSSSILSTTAHDSADEVDSDDEDSERAILEQKQKHEGTVEGEDYREQSSGQPQSQLQISIANETSLMIVGHQEGELTPESTPSLETLVDDQLQPQPQPITLSATGASSTNLSPSTPTLPSNEILIRYFYPIDPVTLTQQQTPVYDDPLCPTIKPIPEWPPPELVEWRKRNSIGRPRNGIGTKKKANATSSDEDEDYSSFSGRPIKRVRWKSVDDVSFFESVPPITVNLRNKPFVSLPAQTPVDGSLYRPISVSPFTPPSEEDGEPSFGRGKRRRTPKRMLTYPVKNVQSRKPLRVSVPPDSDDDFKPQPSKQVLLKPAGDRTCHQCRRSEFGLPKLKMRCSFIKPGGNQCVHQYCETCIINRYDEPFAPSLTAWTCPVCREICNCSLCLRKQGFGYIWDGALANELKHKRLRHRIRHPKNAKSTNGTIYNTDKPSMCKWLARRGVLTGSAAWMTQRRKEGARFVIGRSPSPEPDSSIFVGDSEYVAEFEKMVEDKGEGEEDMPDTAAIDGIPPAEPINPPQNNIDPLLSEDREEETLDTAAVDGTAPAEPIESLPNNDEAEAEMLTAADDEVAPAKPIDPLSARDEGEGETLDTAADDGVAPAESIDPPSELKPNAFDVFAQSNLPRGHFFVGKVLKRKAPRSVSQVKLKNVTALPRRPRKVSSPGMSPDGEKDDAQCVPQPMMILRPPSKTIGFYAKNEDLSEEETDSTTELVVRQQVQEGYLSDQDAEGTSDDGVEEAHWPVKAHDRDNLPGPSLVHSTPPSTCTSNFTTLYTPTSSYTRPPSPSRAFQLLLGVPLTEQGYSLGLNARGLELEKHNMSDYMVEQEGRESHIVGRSPDRVDGNFEIANGLSVDDAPKGLQKTAFDPHTIGSTQDSLNSSVDEYTMPLSLRLPIPGFDDPVKGIYDSSGFDTWFTAENDGEGSAEN